MVFCQNCGNEIAEILKFCPSCGASSNRDESNPEIETNNGQPENLDHKQLRKDRNRELRNRVQRYKPM
jgi:uncharacterized membrane protein YvbJ